MMLARRSGRLSSADKMNTQVFGVEEEKEEEDEEEEEEEEQQGGQKDGQYRNGDDVFKGSNGKRKGEDVADELYAVTKKDKAMDRHEIEKHYAEKDGGREEDHAREHEDTNEVEEPEEVEERTPSQQSTDKDTLSVLEIG